MTLPSRLTKQYRPFFAAALIALAVAALFWPATKFDFIALDDWEYVVGNDLVRGGLTVDGVFAALTTLREGYWIPLTWLSYMADTTIFGFSPEVFHRTNVLLHAAAVALLFLAFNRATGSFWRSAAVCLLFAAHPARVESVAWVTSRKDVLSGVFFAFSLFSYVRYSESRRRLWFVAALASMLFGIAAKPILFILPVALLFFDYWPLSRFRNAGTAGGWLSENRSLLVEKAPFALVSATVVGGTLYAQRGSVATLDNLGAVDRVVFAFNGYFQYLASTFWPVNLVMDDSFGQSGRISLPVALASFAAIAIVTGLAWRFRRSRPEALFGWLWFLIFLFPTSGAVQVGMQLYSNRFTYLPHIGLAAMLAWSVGDKTWPPGRKLFIGAIALVVSALAVATHGELLYWRDSATLFGHFQSVDGPSAFASRHLGVDLGRRGDFAGAVRAFDEALSFNPESMGTRFNKAVALEQLGRLAEAEAEYRLVCERDAMDARALFNLAVLLYRRGDREGAGSCFARFVELTGDDERVRLFLGGR